MSADYQMIKNEWSNGHQTIVERSFDDQTEESTIEIKVKLDGTQHSFTREEWETFSNAIVESLIAFQDME